MNKAPEIHNNIIKAPNLNYEPRGGIGTELFRSMKLHQKKVAQYIVESGENDTYSSLLTRCIRTALHLRAEGLKQKGLICLCTHNHLNSRVPFIAATFLGIKVASLDVSLSVNDVSYLLQQILPTIIFVSSEAVQLIEDSIKQAEIECKIVVFGNSENYPSFSNYLSPHVEEKDFRPVDVSLEETAVIFFSSGTTGWPKGICHNHYALLAQGINILNTGIVSSKVLCYASLYWISTTVILISSIQAGLTTVIPKKFDPHEIWHIIHQCQVYSAFLAPIQASEMFKAGRPDHINTSSLLHLVIGGGAFSDKMLTLLRDLLPGTHVCLIYGQTEVAGMVTSFNVNDVKDTLRLHYKLSSSGRPINGIWYKVVDPEADEILGPNQLGELRIYSKFVMNGYHNMDSSDCYDSDGWLKTGDMVYYDDDLCFYIVDRFKEILKYKSWHVPPAMIENVLIKHPSIKKAVVIGIPDEVDGDLPMAVVILNNPEDKISSEQIKSYVAERVDDRQRLRGGVKFVTSFPITPSGKIKRRILKDRVLAGEI